jgi:pimeloyl-ACP methyl ester carboxylesterase
MNNPEPPFDIAVRNDGVKIAYRLSEGRSPCVVFFGGFKSDMNGTKAMALESHCRKQGRAFLRFDYQGHGQSSGAFEDGTIGCWTEDSLFIIDHLIKGPCVLVGSSMGGWIMLLTALAQPEKVAGLLGIAAAPDFTEDLILASLSAAQKENLEKDGHVDLPSEYDGSYPITKALIEDGREHLLLRQKIPLLVPLRLIHGMKDADVPWQTSLQLSQMIASENVETILVKDGDHRLSEADDLSRINGVLDALLENIERTAP